MLVARRALAWLIAEWPYAGALIAAFLVVLLPLWWHASGLALALVFVQLPVYLIHQLEEHAGDRFRQFVNRHLAGGRDALTPRATMWINIVGVWGVDLAALYLATYVSLAYGLIAAYLPIINALGHIGGALALRAYNPGLATSLGLFLPIGGLAVYTISAQSGADWRHHALAAGIAIVTHAALVVHVRRRIARMNAEDRIVRAAVVQ